MFEVRIPEISLLSACKQLAVTLVFEILFQLQRMTRELAVRNESQEGLLLSHHILEQPIVIVFKGYIYGAILYITRYTYSSIPNSKMLLPGFILLA